MFSILLSLQSANLLANSGFDYGVLHSSHSGEPFKLEIAPEKAARLYIDVKEIASDCENSDASAYVKLAKELDEVCGTQIDWAEIPGMAPRTFISGFGWRVEFVPGDGRRVDATVLHDYDDYNNVVLAGDHRKEFEGVADKGIVALRKCCFDIIG
jgi:hypothetical protein